MGSRVVLGGAGGNFQRHAARHWQVASPAVLGQARGSSAFRCPSRSAVAGKSFPAVAGPAAAGNHLARPIVIIMPRGGGHMEMTGDACLALLEGDWEMTDDPWAEIIRRRDWAAAQLTVHAAQTRALAATSSATAQAAKSSARASNTIAVLARSAALAASAARTAVAAAFAAAPPGTAVAVAATEAARWASEAASLLAAATQGYATSALEAACVSSVAAAAAARTADVASTAAEEAAGGHRGGGSSISGHGDVAAPEPGAQPLDGEPVSPVPLSSEPGLEPLSFTAASPTILPSPVDSAALPFAVCSGSRSPSSRSRSPHGAWSLHGSPRWPHE